MPLLLNNLLCQDAAFPLSGVNESGKYLYVKIVLNQSISLIVLEMWWSINALQSDIVDN